MTTMKYYWGRYLLFLGIISYGVACQNAAATPTLLSSTNNPVSTPTSLAQAEIIQPVTVQPSPTSIPIVIALITEPTIPVQIPDATAIAPTPTPAVFAGGGWLLFESQREDTNEDGVISFKDGIHLYSLDLLTNELHQLTTGKSHDIHPVWSPDRGRILFASNRSGNFDLYTIHNDGSNLQQLTNAPNDEVQPAWSPDGSQIAFISVETFSDGTQMNTLLLMNTITGSIQSAFTEAIFVEDMDWSPDSKYLAFTRRELLTDEVGFTRNEHRLYLWEPTTGQTVLLPLPYSEQYGYAAPKWVNREGYHLSVVRVPGAHSSVSIEVYELVWRENNLTILQGFTFEGTSGMAAWGANGEWLFVVLYNDGPADGRSLSDIAVTPVRYDGLQGRTTHLGQLSSPNFFLTNNNFYDSRPDWHP